METCSAMSGCIGFVDSSCREGWCCAFKSAPAKFAGSYILAAPNTYVWLPASESKSSAGYDGEEVDTTGKTPSENVREEVVYSYVSC